ncbi:MAG: carboxypeptidase-like regulatory domain-containing protein [Candidatus Poribacteria bacterium]
MFASMVSIRTFGLRFIKPPLWLFFTMFVASVFLSGCGDVQVDTKTKPETGAIRGFISPVTVKDAVVKVYRDGIFIASARVNDTGRYTLEGLPEGEYDLSIVAEGYLMDSPIRSIRVRAGQTTDVGRTVLTLIPPDRQSDRRPQDADVDVFVLRVEGMF